MSFAASALPHGTSLAPIPPFLSLRDIPSGLRKRPCGQRKEISCSGESHSCWLPSWRSGPGVNRLFGADRIDMQGSEFRVGFVRGIDLSGDWGLSFVKTTIAE